MKWSCKWLGHIWIPIAVVKNKKYKFLGCYCKICNFGKDELSNYITDNKVDICSYNLEYFKQKQQLSKQKER